MRRADVAVFVIVRAFEADAVAVEAEMAVRFHEAGIDAETGKIDHFVRSGKVLPDRFDLTVFYKDIRGIGFRPYCVVYASVFQ